MNTNLRSEIVLGIARQFEIHRCAATKLLCLATQAFFKQVNLFLLGCLFFFWTNSSTAQVSASFSHSGGVCSTSVSFASSASTTAVRVTNGSCGAGSHFLCGSHEVLEVCGGYWECVDWSYYGGCYYEEWVVEYCYVTVYDYYDQTTTPCGIASYSWNFGDGTTSTSSSPSHTYSGAGTYTVTLTVVDGCGNSTAVTQTVTVTMPPATPAPITGTSTVCAGGATTALSDATAGGSWSSSNTSVATVNSSGVVTGVATGTSNISYSVSNSCGTANAESVVTVNPLPSGGTISGTTTLCPGVTTTLSESVSGGTWSSSNTSVASINSSGFVGTVAAGSSTISYAVTNSCGTAYSTAIFTVNPLPDPGSISGASTFCPSTAYTLGESSSGGSWSSSNTSVATIDAAGIATGVSAGSAVISYTVSNVCGTAYATKPVTVIPEPTVSAISGAVSFCPGTTIALTDSVSGGTWSSSNTAQATVDSTGVVTAVNDGGDTIVYTVSNYCGSATASTQITIISASVDSIAGPTSVCVGATALFSTTTTGFGGFSSSDTSKAVISAAGELTGIAPGSVDVVYILDDICGFAVGSVSISVLNVAAVGPIQASADSVCVGATLALTDTTTGGTWTSGDTSKATVSTIGVLSGVSRGTVMVSYTVTDICGTTTVTVPITIDDVPSVPAMTGAIPFCSGTTLTTLSDSVSGGVWSSANMAMATVSASSGVVSGVLAGVDTIYYTVTNECGPTVVSTPVTIIPAYIAPITGRDTAICAGDTITLSTASTGSAYAGSWGSLYSAVATVSSSGVVTGVARGTTTIYYSITDTCGVINGYYNITVNDRPAVAPISTGATSVCAGSIITLTDTTASGTWTSSDSTLAMVGASSGAVSGVAAGTAVISYTLTNICGSTTVTLPVTVRPLPEAGTITGPSTICAGGATTALADTVAGGTWSSSNPSIATVDGSGGVTSGIAGTDSISYAVTNGCGTIASTIQITVNPLPNAGIIAGTPTVCVGAITALSDTITGGTWTSYDPSTATIDSYGHVTGVAPGVDTISYLISNSCGSAIAIESVTVNPLPHSGTISGPTTVCAGTSITLSDTVAGGSWTSGFASIATVNSAAGIVTGVSPGADTIFYSVTNGCGTSVASYHTTVKASSLPAIAGPDTVCRGTAGTLSDAVVGGNWASLSPSTVSINSSTGDFSAVSTGTARLLYSLSDGCGSGGPLSVYTSITVITLPSVPAITGGSTICVGSSITLSNTLSGGIWNSTDASIASISSVGNVTGVSPGTTSVSYSVTNSCGTTSVSKSVSVNPLPDAGIIYGTSTLCNGDSTTFTDSSAGGVWSSSSPSVLTVNGTGSTNALAAGSATITYSTSNSCGTASSTHAVSVIAIPHPAPISGPSSICLGSSTATMTDTSAGGIWTSANPSVASVSAAGVLTGVSGGSSTISYTVTNMCGTSSATQGLSVVPYAGAISGSASNVCVGSTLTLTDAATGGAWTTSSSIATVTTGGLVTAISAGVDTIKYSVTASGCGTAVARYVVTISSPSVPAITGSTTSVCPGAVITFSDAAGGGTWSNSNNSVATVSSGSGAIVTGVSPGRDTISYTLTNICGTYTATKAITVTSPTFPGGISGSGSAICPGSTTAFSDGTAGGVWSSSNSSIATVSSTGMVTGVAGGTDTILYSITNSCGQVGSASKQVTVTPSRVSAISGPINVCVASSIALSDSTTGGAWTSSSTTVASVSSSGVVYGIAAGSTTITYGVTSSCGTIFATYAVSVSAPGAVAAISGGTSPICPGATASLSDATTGSSMSWSSSNTAITTVNTSTGIVTGVAPGTDTITYTVTNACGTVSAIKSISVIGPTIPGRIAGSSGAICPGSTTTFSDGTGGGTWSSTNTAIATVSSAGVVTGVSGGNDTILYSITNSCGQVGYALKALTVTPTTVSAITGPVNVCTGSSITLGDTSSGGVWSSTSTTVATVSSGGVVYGSAAGNTTIEYTLTSSCGAFFASHSVTVSAPGAIAPITGGSSSLCVGSTMALSDATTGSSYAWSSSNTTKATVNSVTGIVTGVFGGTDTVTYTVTNACGTVSTIKAFSVIGPTLPEGIAGSSSVCQGATTALSDGTSGGAWTSGNTSVATISSSGVVTGVSAGLDTMTYSITNSCGEVGSVIKAMTVLPLPNPGTITGNSSVIVGHNDTLSHSVSGGTWSSVSTSIATINSSGILRGVSPGSDTVKYTVTNSCGPAVASYAVVVHASRPGISPGGTIFVNGQDKDGAITLYPNPANSSLNIVWSGAAEGTARIIITDVLGRNLYDANWDLALTEGKTAADVSTLGSGVYIVSIKSGMIHYSGRIVVEQ